MTFRLENGLAMALIAMLTVSGEALLGVAQLTAQTQCCARE
jgi:hypothetical protein